jgi:hypothetical protein
MRLFTRIVVLNGGMNLLGALELAAFLGIALVLCPPDNLTRNRIMVFMTGLLVLAVDIAWRLSQQHAGRVWRWVSPFEGGCICFLPGWVLGTLLVGGSVVTWMMGVR